MLDACRWHFDGVAFLLAAPVLSSSRTPHEAHVNCGQQKKHVHMRARTLAGCMLEDDTGSSGADRGEDNRDPTVADRRENR